MADSKFTLDIVTPDRLIASMSDVVSLIVPAEEGYLGVLAGHAPLIARLVPGEIKIKHSSGTEELMSTSGGFLEVSSERVTILADAAERTDEIDVQRALAAYRRAQERLHSHDPGIDIDRARMAMERAAARLRTVGHPVT